jgi:hypothetical protein
MNGGSAQGKQGINKRLEGKEAGLAVLSAAAGRKNSGMVPKAEAKAEGEKEEQVAVFKNENQPKPAPEARIEMKRQTEKEPNQKQAHSRALESAGVSNPEIKAKTVVPMRSKKEPLPKTPALEQLDLVGKLTRNLDRIHGR